jgi:hypothetical protein
VLQKFASLESPALPAAKPVFFYHNLSHRRAVDIEKRPTPAGTSSAAGLMLKK